MAEVVVDSEVPAGKPGVERRHDGLADDARDEGMVHVLLAETADDRVCKPDGEREEKADQEDRIPGEKSPEFAVVTPVKAVSAEGDKEDEGKGDRYTEEAAVPGRKGEEEEGGRVCRRVGAAAEHGAETGPEGELEAFQEAGPEEERGCLQEGVHTRVIAGRVYAVCDRRRRHDHTTDGDEGPDRGGGVTLLHRREVGTEAEEPAGEGLPGRQLRFS
ncbi:hypothetical protein DSECCO2_476140 [anaerobic digester metagenome]